MLDTNVQVSDTFSSLESNELRVVNIDDLLKSQHKYLIAITSINAS